MQVYSGRDDDEAIADVFIEIINQISFEADYDENANFLLSALRSTDINLNQIKRLLPQIKRFLAELAGAQGDLFILLDDFHVVTKELQPKLLDAIYAVARGNKIYLKISAIEAFVRTFDPETSVGLEVPHDVQIIGLDYNLTAPDKATAHIEAILDAHAQYAGIPSIRRLCSSADVIPRLTWVAAGVPRDALNLFSQAMTKASVEGRQRVTVSNVNVAASENLSSKLRELKADASKSASDLQRFLDRVKDFCVSKKRSNAFLVEIRSDDDLFDKVMKLVNLRFLHVISEGITVGEAGKKYVGLILDYGFYTGIRAAQSVDLFNRQTERPSYKELRRLPVLRPA